MENSKKLKAFFFRAMLGGWTTSGRKQTSKEFPGYKVATFSEGRLRLVDSWCVRPKSDMSYGFTTIWENDTPVWVMHYGGCYPKEVIHVVKAALAKAYSDKHFFGGRGPIAFRMDGFEYNNDLNDSAFEDFSGREYISVPGKISEIGSHSFFGGLL